MKDIGNVWLLPQAEFFPMAGLSTLQGVKIILIWVDIVLREIEVKWLSKLRTF